MSWDDWTSIELPFTRCHSAYFISDYRRPKVMFCVTKLLPLSAVNWTKTTSAASRTEPSELWEVWKCCKCLNCSSPSNPKLNFVKHLVNLRYWGFFKKNFSYKQQYTINTHCRPLISFCHSAKIPPMALTWGPVIWRPCAINSLFSTADSSVPLHHISTHSSTHSSTSIYNPSSPGQPVWQGASVILNENHTQVTKKQ